MTVNELQELLNKIPEEYKNFEIIIDSPEVLSYIFLLSTYVVRPESSQIILNGF